MRILQRVVSGAAVVALFALAMWFTDVEPHLVAKEQNPIITQGHVGAVVENRVFTVKVDRVDVASGIVKDDGRRMPTPGIFVMVHLSAKSNIKPMRLGHVRLVTRGGLSYDDSGRVDIITPDPPLEPMLWRSLFYVFEIPKDRLAGARLVVGQSDLINNLSAESQVDLRIGADKAAQMLAHPSTDYALKPS